MSFNKVILVGNVGKDPDIFNFQNGGNVASFPLATTERGFTTRDGNQIPDRTDWHNIKLSNGLANVAEKWVKKGDLLLVEGKIRTRSFTDKNNETRYITEIIGENMRMLGGKKNTNESPKNNDQSSYSPAGEQPEGFTSNAEQSEDGFPF